MDPLNLWIASYRLMLAVAIYVNHQGGDYRTQLRAIATEKDFTEEHYDAIRKIIGDLGGGKQASTTSIKFAARKLLEQL